MLNGFERLNQYHYKLSMNFKHRPSQPYIDNVTYINDLEFENHDVKLLKYKQFVYINRKLVRNY